MFSRRQFTLESKFSRQTGKKDGLKKVEWRGGKVDGTTSSMTTRKQTVPKKGTRHFRTNNDFSPLYKISLLVFYSVKKCVHCHVRAESFRQLILIFALNSSNSWRLSFMHQAMFIYSYVAQF